MSEYEKVFQIIGMPADQSIKSFTFLFSKAFAEILNKLLWFKKKKRMTFGTVLGKDLKVAASVNMFYIAIDYKNNTVWK